MAYKYFIKGCVFCGTCVSECPEEAITMTSEGAVINQAKCVGCGVCYDNCPSEAIQEIEIKKEE